MTIIMFILIIVGIVWLANDSHSTKKTMEYNRKLFIRSHNHELFLMRIYDECPKPVQDKIEKYLKESPSL